MMSEISDKAKLTTFHYERRSLGRNKCKTNYMARWVLTKYNTRNVDNSTTYNTYAERILLAIQDSIIQRYAESHTLTTICGQQRNHDKVKS